MNRQSWVRQNITAGEPADRRQARHQRRISTLIHVTKLAAFGLLLAFYTRALPMPAASSLRLIAGDARVAASDAYWIQPALLRAPAGGSVRLPAGHFFLPQGAIAGSRAVAITGAGAARTILALGGSPGGMIGDPPLGCDRHAEGCRLDPPGLLASDLSLIVIPSAPLPGDSHVGHRR